MSADIVQARYDELDRLAAGFAKASAASAELHARVSRCVEALEHGGWEGRGAEAFFAEMHSTLYPAMQRLIKALEQGRAAILQAKEILRAAEQEAAALWRQGSAGPAIASVGGGQAESGGVLGFVGDLFSGAGAELGDMIHGIGNLVLHPVDTVNGLWYGVNHPGALWDALKKPYVDDWENGHPGRAIGRGILFAGSLLIGTKGADKAAEIAGAAGRVGDAAEIAGTAGRVGDAAEVAGTAGRVGESADAAGTAGDLSRGAAAAAKGAAREQHVAELIGGRVTAGEKVVAKGIGSTDIDVVGPAGELVTVGGPAKVKDLGKLGKHFKILKALAEERGVEAFAYFEEGTPEPALQLARKWLGEDKVKVFPPPPAP